MNYEQEVEEMECLLEALYPELFPGTPLCARSPTHVSRAIEESERCRSLAKTFQEHLGAMRKSRLRPERDRKELANRLFIEVASSTDLWEEALALIESCEEWSSTEERAENTLA